MDRDFIIKNANELLYTLISEYTYYPFTKCIHPNDVEEFENTCKNVVPDKNSKLIIRVHDNNLDYHVFDAAITAGVSEDGEIIGYNIKMYDLLTVESIYTRNTANVRKYRNYMSMIDVYYFEYDFKDNVFKVFVYIAEKSKVLVDGDFDDWCDSEGISGACSEKDKLAFQKLRSSIKNGLSNFTVKFTASYFTKDNSYNELSFFGKTISMPDGNHVYGIIRNSAEWNDNNTIYYLTESAKDSATGLFNKRAVTEYSKDLIRQGLPDRRYMIIIDIDNFKHVNDTYGHFFGDKVILTVSRILANVVNARGIVGRIGGDEFYILTENIKTEEALRIIMKTIQKNIGAAFDGNKDDFRVSISSGISCYPNDGTEYDILFKKADRALYVAKEKGKARYIIYSEEKHGAVSLNEDTIDRYNPLFKTELCANSIADLAIQLSNQGTDCIDEILKAICGYFDISGIRVIKINNDNDKREYKELYSCGRYKRAYKQFDIFGISEYVKLYNEFSMYAENNVKNILKYSGLYYQEIEDDDIVSFVHLAYKNADNPNIFMSFDMFDKKRKWSEEDKNYLLIIGKLILERISRNL